MLALAIAILSFIALVSQALVLPTAEQLSLLEELSLSSGADASQGDQTCPQRIAIVGSGITGAVAAFRLYEGYRLTSLPTQRPCITVFERNAIIGGRITQAYVYDDPRFKIDTCATTFSLQDTCIVSAVAGVGLDALPEQLVRPVAGTGVWNGKEIIGFVDEAGFREPILWSFYKSSKWLQRYKQAPFEFESAALTARLSFDQLLQSAPFTVPEIPLPVTKNLSHALEQSLTAKYLQGPLCSNASFEKEGEQEFLAEAVLPGLRERYFIEGPDFNLLDLYFGFNDVTPSFILDGNLRLVERLLKLSSAEVRLNTEVQEIRSQELSGSQSFLISSRNLFDGTSKTERFDTVVMATSLDRGNITFAPQLPDVPGLKQEYTDSFVTHFTTPSLLNPAFFNYTGDMPQRILTYNSDQLSAVDNVQGSLKQPPFFSLTLVQRLASPSGAQGIENLFKLVSESEISDSEIASYLQNPVISWMHREPLPQSVPITPLNKEEPCRKFLQDIEIVPGIFYAGGGEQVLASAEFACRMASNAARLILDGAAVEL